MPGFFLTVSSVVLCTHGGKAQPTALNPRVTVMGQPTVLQPAPWVVAGCAFPPPPAANGPCVTAQWVVGSVRIKSMGMPFLLQDSQAICAPTGTPFNVVAAQPRVKGT
jgi:hypothetical protein